MIQSFFFFFFLFISNHAHFLSFSNEQEFEIVCNGTSEHCLLYHEKYRECGKKIFKLWFLLDLIQSISVQDVEHSYLYTDALMHIVEIYENLFNINDYSEFIHKKDIENIEYFLQKVLSHQVIQSIDCLKNITISCQELFDQIKQ
jgi:hypothetical protein